MKLADILEAVVDIPDAFEGSIPRAEGEDLAASRPDLALEFGEELGGVGIGGDDHPLGEKRAGVPADADTIADRLEALDTAAGQDFSTRKAGDPAHETDRIDACVIGLEDRTAKAGAAAEIADFRAANPTHPEALFGKERVAFFQGPLLPGRAVDRGQPTAFGLKEAVDLAFVEEELAQEGAIFSGEMPEAEGIVRAEGLGQGREGFGASGEEVSGIAPRSAASDLIGFEDHRLSALQAEPPGDRCTDDPAADDRDLDALGRRGPR